VLKKIASVVIGRILRAQRLEKNRRSLFQNPPVEEVALVGSVRGLKKIDTRETAIRGHVYYTTIQFTTQPH
jgi:hypothetical protein